MRQHFLTLAAANATAFWAVAFHTNSHSPRARKWYRVSRMVIVDGMTFEIYWHQNANLRGDNLATVRKLAHDANVILAPGVYTDAESPKLGSEMRRVY